MQTSKARRVEEFHKTIILSYYPYGFCTCLDRMIFNYWRPCWNHKAIFAKNHMDNCHFSQWGCRPGKRPSNWILRDVRNKIHHEAVKASSLKMKLEVGSATTKWMLQFMNRKLQDIKLIQSIKLQGRLRGWYVVACYDTEFCSVRGGRSVVRRFLRDS